MVRKRGDDYWKRNVLSSWQKVMIIL